MMLATLDLSFCKKRNEVNQFSFQTQASKNFHIELEGMLEYMIVIKFDNIEIILITHHLLSFR